MVVTEKQIEKDGGTFLKQSAFCFYCSRQMRKYPVVMWQGERVQIWLHWECAAKLSRHLAFDSVHAEKEYIVCKRGKT